MSKKLTHPEGGSPIDTAGMPVTTEPIPGGVHVENCSLPADHEARVVYRELSSGEKRLQKRSAAEHAAFSRVDSIVFLRLTRDALLRETDHMETYGTKAEQAKWAKWRQELRDLPTAWARKKKNLDDVAFPTPPKVTSVLIGHRRLWPGLDWEKLF